MFSLSFIEGVFSLIRGGAVGGLAITADSAFLPFLLFIFVSL